jgi:hypothetical protein
MIKTGGLIWKVHIAGCAVVVKITKGISHTKVKF